MADATRNLNDGPVWRALAAMSAPMTLGILAVFSVGIVDAYFLGRVGETELAAVGYIYPVTIAVTSLSVGLSAGANAALSQAIGREDDALAVKRKGLHAVGLATILSVLGALAFWLLHRPLFGALGAEAETLEAISAYVPVWAASFPFLVGMMVINAIFRAHGDSRVAATTMVAAAAINVALDPLLIFGWGPVPALEMAGAAWATMIGRIAALALALWIATRRGLLDTCSAPLKDLWGSVREIGRVGGPSAFANAINPAGLALVTAAVATVGEAAVAGFGAASRVQSLVLVPLFALSAGIGPVVGQAWGAGDRDRARRALLWACGFCVAWGLAAAALVFAFASPLAGVLASGEDDARYAAQYLRIVIFSLVGYGVMVVVNAAMNARSKALHSMALGIVRTFGLFLPLAWLAALTVGYPGILWAAVAANLGAIWLAAVLARKTGLLAWDGWPVAAPARALPG